MKIAGKASLKSVERMNLCDLYQQTTDALNDVIRGAKSRTLERLYTEEYQPAIQGVNLTKVQSLETGEPVVVRFSSRCTDLNFFYPPGKLYEYFLYDMHETELLGSKSFAIASQGKNIEVFKPGLIMSRGNDKYSGTQIRLLQAACEEASKHNIKTMPLNSVFSSTRFHTMMGFRPNEVQDKEITSLEGAYDMLESVKEKTSADGTYFIPILTKRDDKFFFDPNRTLYYAAMRYAEETIAKENVRHLDMLEGDCNAEIKMSLKGNELADWFKRIIGFRIMPEGSEKL